MALSRPAPVGPGSALRLRRATGSPRGDATAGSSNRTPDLTRSTPTRGARDFLVPVLLQNVHGNRWPQSPQLFKHC